MDKHNPGDYPHLPWHTRTYKHTKSYEPKVDLKISLLSLTTFPGLIVQPFAWIPKKSRNTSEQPTCHDLLIVLRYAMKSRVIYLYWLSRRNCIYLFIVIFILCYSCSPSKYRRALNCQNLYVRYTILLYRT